MAFRRLDRYDRLDVRPWPVDPSTHPLDPSRRVKGFPYSPPPTFGHRRLLPQPWRGIVQVLGIGAMIAFWCYVLRTL